MFLKKISVIAVAFLGFAWQSTILAQPTAKAPSRFDYGRMWTFENAPVDYIEQTYGFRPDEAWLKRARSSALRFASWCSASFISPNGLIMTNHHCSRGEMGKIMKEGEDFDKNGFYAATAEEERQVEGLFVSQLKQMADITEYVNNKLVNAKTPEERQSMLRDALAAAKAEYAEKADWTGLDIQSITYYSGMRYSLYGYKKYTDIRLVMIPELQLGFYGGDPDNFTYPRYNLDCTFWRAYENGKPVDTREFHYPVNVNGIQEGNATFVIGNPGSTERYRTVAQLEYDRDYRYKIQNTFMKNRMNIMQEKLDAEYSHELQENIFGISNSVKAVDGILGGLHRPDLMGRKVAMEESIKAKAIKTGSEDHWAGIAKGYKALEPYASEITLLSPNPMGGATIQLAHAVKQFSDGVDSDKLGAEDIKKLEDEIRELAKGLEDPYEVKRLTSLLTELQMFADKDDKYVGKLLDGRSPEKAAKEILAETKFTSEKGLEKLLDKPKRLERGKDPIAAMANLLVPEYEEAMMAFRNSSPSRRALEGKVANEVYKVYGVDVPPDATFTLRLADGVVKGYNYNGTTAPYMTTYYGLYDRHYSNGGKFPWALPDRWLNPPTELLKSPMNYVSTNDIIGGNSGSPMVNKDLEVIGLIFDGNIESLPGNFIFDEEANRTVSVHIGGIVAALRYIYKADRLVSEMVTK